uniref:Uncharacterized protein n=1 Tax=Anguilla anguilla TaxID=7936 RepID=A0A0E9UP18_ANGAN
MAFILKDAVPKKNSCLMRMRVGAGVC